MITSNHQDAKYKNNGIVNGSRGYIDSIHTSKQNPDEVEIIWVRFSDDKTGQMLREDNKSLLRTHPPKDSKSVPIRRQKKGFNMKGNTKYVRSQFPLTLCYAITSHKSQGQTLDEVIIDFTNAKGGIAAGSFYVAMSRVRLGENLYLRGFEENYIQANPLVERQLNAIKISSPYNFKKIYMEKEIYEKIGHELKIAYININSLYEGKSHIFLNNDENLLQLDFLLVADTRLTSHNSQEELEERLENWRMIRRFDADDGFRHMGLLLLQSKSSNMTHLQIETAKKYWNKKIRRDGLPLHSGYTYNGRYRTDSKKH